MDFGAQCGSFVTQLFSTFIENDMNIDIFQYQDEEFHFFAGLCTLLNCFFDSG